MAEAGLNIVPIDREAASDQVVAQLLGLVKAGNLKAGDRLASERELAVRFGVSRPTIREAVRALSVLGVLRIQHGGGIFVSQLQAADLLGPLTFFLSLRASEIDELYQARRLIEGEIAKLAATRATPDDCATLARLIEDQRQAVKDPRAYRLVDVAFHGTLADIAANGFLARVAASLNVLGQEFRAIASETPNLISGSIDDHLAILEALRAGDGDGARAAMERHMQNVLESTRRSIAERAAHQADERTA